MRERWLRAGKNGMGGLGHGGGGGGRGVCSDKTSSSAPF